MTDDMNNTLLDPLKAAEINGPIHRDYLAHCLRWAFVGRLIGSNEVIADIGAGVGNLEETLWRNKLRPKTVYAVEVHPAFIEKLKELKTKLNYHMDVIEHDIRKMPLPLQNNVCDTVTCFEVVEHVEPKHINFILSELARIVKPEGRVLLSTPNYATSGSRINREEAFKNLLKILEFKAGCNKSCPLKTGIINSIGEDQETKTQLSTSQPVELTIPNTIKSIRINSLVMQDEQNSRTYLNCMKYLETNANDVEKLIKSYLKYIIDQETRKRMEISITTFLSSRCLNCNSCVQTAIQELTELQLYQDCKADNHIYEYTEAELQAELEKHFTIVRKFGTFMSTGLPKQAKLVLTPGDYNLFMRLREYYSPNLLSVLFAPVYPSQSRNILWVLKKKVVVEDDSHPFSELITPEDMDSTPA